MYLSILNCFSILCQLFLALQIIMILLCILQRYFWPYCFSLFYDYWTHIALKFLIYLYYFTRFKFTIFPPNLIFVILHISIMLLIIIYLLLFLNYPIFFHYIMMYPTILTYLLYGLQHIEKAKTCLSVFIVHALLYDWQYFYFIYFFPCIITSMIATLCT